MSNSGKIIPNENDKTIVYHIIWTQICTTLLNTLSLPYTLISKQYEPNC